MKHIRALLVSLHRVEMNHSIIALRRVVSISLWSSLFVVAGEPLLAVLFNFCAGAVINLRIRNIHQHCDHEGTLHNPSDHAPRSDLSRQPSDTLHIFQPVSQPLPIVQ